MDMMAVVLAGGRGSRLMPLTLNRAKPAVPFGGKYVIFDFVMNSIINSGIKKTIVLTQYAAQPLIDHIDRFGFSNPFFETSVRIVPAQMRTGKEWYAGTADAVFQNLDFILREGVKYVAILAGDHIYNIDLSQVLSYHKEKQSQFTICSFLVESNKAAGNFGVLEVDDNCRVIGFEEKPADPKEVPTSPGFSFVSMGNYIVDVEFLLEILQDDAKNKASEHDFGKNIIPKIIRDGHRVFAYDFSKNNIEGQGNNYWRDVGRISEYFEANMDLVQNEPVLNLYNKNWKIRTFPDHLPPAKVVRDFESLTGTKGIMMNFIAAGGCIFDAPQIIQYAVFGREVRVDYGAIIEEAVIFDGVKIGANCVIKKAIIDEGVLIPDGIEIGINHTEDEKKGLIVREGITIVPSGFEF